MIFFNESRRDVLQVVTRHALITSFHLPSFGWHHIPNSPFHQLIQWHAITKTLKLFPKFINVTDACNWSIISHLQFIQLNEMLHLFHYPSHSQGVSEWILHILWLFSIQSDRLISTLSKSTPALPVKAVSLLRSRWVPRSNKQESWFHTVWPARCEVRTLRTK